MKDLITTKEKTARQREKVSQASHLVVEILRYEYTKRAEKNPSYSQRAFAKHLGVSHTLLSLIFKGERKPSGALVDKIGERFNYSSEKMGRLKKVLSQVHEQKRPQKLNQEEEFSLDQFALISEWQNYAILSLLEIKSTRFEADYIAKRLGISPVLAKLSMQRLVRLNLVVQDANGRWRQRSGPIVINSNRSTEAGRKFQRQLIEKALDSIASDPEELRDASSTTFAMNPKNVPYAIERIRAFRRQLTDELEVMDESEEVYNLTVQLFPSSRRGVK